MEKGERTELLNAWRSGDKSALNTLVEIVYAELWQRANQFMARERVGHTLQPAGLVHEVFLRFAQSPELGGSRTQFLGFSAHLMRQVLIDHARKKSAEKRGGGIEWVSFFQDMKGETESRFKYENLESALKQLEANDPRKAQIVILRFYGGLTLDEIGEQLNISKATIKREWVFARTWLFSQLQ